jgi:hypothetical protein
MSLISALGRLKQEAALGYIAKQKQTNKTTEELPGSELRRQDSDISGVTQAPGVFWGHLQDKEHTERGGLAT